MADNSGPGLERFVSAKGYAFISRRDPEGDVIKEQWRLDQGDKRPQIFAAYSSPTYAGSLIELYHRVQLAYATLDPKLFRKALERLVLVGRHERFAGDLGIVVQLVQKKSASPGAKGRYELSFHEVKRKNNCQVVSKTPPSLSSGNGHLSKPDDQEFDLAPELQAILTPDKSRHI